MLLSIFVFIIGLAILILSSDYLVQSSVKLSLLFRLSPLFIGLILVAFGTSAPESGVGIVAAVKNQKDIALGNIVGSNISNIGLILGLCALIQGLNIQKSVLRRELPLMIFSTVLIYVLCLDLILTRWDGLILLGLFGVFLAVSYRTAKTSFTQKEVENFQFKGLMRRPLNIFAIIVIGILSLVGLVGGADLMVRSGVSLARTLGISSWVIALTAFAIGTSLPELAASLSASLKRVPSISVGNIVGSNIFNILFVLGIVSLIRPVRLSPEVLRFEMPVMVVFSFLLWILMRTGYRISRKEGLFLLSGYILFLFFIFRRG